jgi:hypothetical protein
VRLALFPRLKSEDWIDYKEILLEGIDDELLLALRDKKVLEEDYAYGHETRHLAARRWFLEHLRAQTEFEASALIFRLACRVHSVEPSTWPFASALAWFASLSEELALNDSSRALSGAALALLPGAAP